MTQPASTFGSIFDLDNYTDAVSNAIDQVGDVASSIADAGKLIGGILKTVAPVMGFVPGLGTAFGIAVYAAGAIAAKDKITDALIGTASTGMPPGVPRIAFDGAASITKDIAGGRNAFTSAVNACREAAGEAGGLQAVAAFDSALAIGRGQKVDDRVISAGRAMALTGGGQAAAISFDAGLSIAQNGDADLVVLDVSRGYIRDMGGPTAIAAFDGGFALACGKTLQEAGYITLHTFVKGNDAQEKILNFIEQVGRAKSLRMAVEDVVTSDLTHTLLGEAAKMGIPKSIKETLQPYVDEVQGDLSKIDIPSGKLAELWGNLSEALVRVAQVVMRNGVPDWDFLQMLENAFDHMKDLAREGRAIAAQDPRSEALRGSGANDSWRFGYDVGSAVAYGLSQFGPGQEAVRASVDDPDFYAGFNAARDMQYMLTRIAAGVAAAVAARFKDYTTLETRESAMAIVPAGLTPQAQRELNAYAVTGYHLSISDKRVGAARNLLPVGQLQQGFDIGVGVASGSIATGPNQERIKKLLTPDAGGSLAAVSGFELGQAVAFGIEKQRRTQLAVPVTHPDFQMGHAVAQGLTGSGFTPDQKAGVMGAVITNPAAKQGAALAIDQISSGKPKSVWSRIWVFLFGT